MPTLSERTYLWQQTEDRRKRYRRAGITPDATFSLAPGDEVTASWTTTDCTQFSSLVIEIEAFEGVPQGTLWQAVDDSTLPHLAFLNRVDLDGDDVKLFFGSTSATSEGAVPAAQKEIQPHGMMPSGKYVIVVAWALATSPFETAKAALWINGVQKCSLDTGNALNLWCTHVPPANQYGYLKSMTNLGATKPADLVVGQVPAIMSPRN